MKEPRVIEDKSGVLTVILHGQELTVKCDTDKWIPKWGICDSGSTMRFSFHPKKKLDIKKEK